MKEQLLIVGTGMSRRLKALGLSITMWASVASVIAQLPTKATTRANEALKPPLRGLLSMGDIRFHREDGGVAENSLTDLEALPSVFDGVILNFAWSQLEPKQGAVDPQPVEAALASIRAYNSHHPDRPLRVGLRIWPGPNAPVWAKKLGGDPVVVYHKDMPITVGRFWTKPYRDAWRDLLDQLGRRFDAEPLIAQISNSSGSTITDEPFIIPGDPISVANLNKAGFSDEAFRDLRDSSPDDFRAWPTTRVDLAINPYRTINSGKPVVDDDTTAALVRSWRQKMGDRGIVANHALNSPPIDKLVPIYNLIKQLGQPIEFQTHSPEGLNWDGTIQYGVSLGATAIELWPGIKAGGFRQIPGDTLRAWAQQLRDNHALSASAAHHE